MQSVPSPATILTGRYKTKTSCTQWGLWEMIRDFFFFFFFASWLSPGGFLIELGLWHQPVILPTEEAEARV